MPTWLKCINCGENFYTAKSYQFIADKVCEKCGSELKPNSKPYKQKRKYPRFKIEKEVEYKLNENDRENNFKPGKTIDLSSNGILITTKKHSLNQVEKNKKVFLKIKDDITQLNLKGRIARTTEIKRGNKNKLGLGIEFLNINEEKKKNLEILQTKTLSAS